MRVGRTFQLLSLQRWKAMERSSSIGGFSLGLSGPPHGWRWRSRLFLVLFQSSRKFFPITFFGSITWIAVFSYLMVWWAHQVRPWEEHPSAWFCSWLPKGSLMCLLWEKVRIILCPKRQRTYSRTKGCYPHWTSPCLLAFSCGRESSQHNSGHPCGGGHPNTSCPL